METIVGNEIASIIKNMLIVVGALIPIVNPPGQAPIFLAMTEGASEETRRVMSARVAWYCFALLAGSLLIGTHILDFFGISLPVVRVGGGLLVIASSWRLLHDDQDDHPAAPNPTQWTREELARRAFYPLSFPLTVGPGSISIAVALGANVRHTRFKATEFVANLIAVSVVALSIYLCFRFAPRLVRALGVTGQIIFLRLSSFILLCIGVQIMWGGLSELISGMMKPLLR